MVSLFRRHYQFQNRKEAGQKLAKALSDYADTKPVILALPRGGVPVAAEVAKEFEAPLTVVVARKLGAPSNPEFGIGAVAENEVTVLDEETIERLGVSKDSLLAIQAFEEGELDRRVYLYRNGKALVGLADRTVILVDDGLATGVTALAAIKAVRRLKPTKIVMATPVCAYDTARMLESAVDDLVCVFAPESLGSIGAYYQNFEQTSDQEVLSILSDAKPIPAMTRIV